jgi:hypothetical protein
MGVGSGGGTDVPDYEVFNDVSDFTAPTIGQLGGVDLISRLSGGYKVVGNLVYVSMTMYLNKNAFSDSTDWSNSAFVKGLPECATWAPVPAGRWGINNVMTGTLGKYGAGQSAWISIGVIPNEVKTASDPRIVVQFVYEKKH